VAAGMRLIKAVENVGALLGRNADPLVAQAAASVA
jgi:hypothetical protein